MRRARQAFGFPCLLLFPAVLAQSTPVQPGEASPSVTAPDPTTANYVPPNTISATPSYFGATGPSATSSLGLPGFLGSTRETVAELLQNPLQWGPFTAHPHLNYGFTYATGVLVGPGRDTDTALHSVAPGLLISSRHLSIDYTPTLNYYSKGPYEDSLNHSATLRSVFGYGDWVFSIDHAYQKTTNPTIETGFQTTIENNSTGLEATWNFSEKVYFDFTLSQQLQDAENFQSYSQWSTMEWVNYRLTQQLSIGGGIGGGYAAVDLGSDMTYEQFQGRLNWQPSRKLSFNVNGGIEVRQFIDTPDSDDLINPLFGASVQYRPFDYTLLSLYANQSVNSSLFENQIIETTTVGAGVNQRLLKYLNLNVSGGYRKSDYKFTFFFFNQQFQSLREDEFAFVNTTLSTSFLRKGTLSVGYQHSTNDSSLTGYNFDSDQVSVRVGYRF